MIRAAGGLVQGCFLSTKALSVPRGQESCSGEQMPSRQSLWALNSASVFQDPYLQLSEMLFSFAIVLNTGRDWPNYRSTVISRSRIQVCLLCYGAAECCNQQPQNLRGLICKKCISCSHEVKVGNKWGVFQYLLFRDQTSSAGGSAISSDLRAPPGCSAPYQQPGQEPLRLYRALHWLSWWGLPFLLTLHWS